ncbi:MAG: SynChlorMet cassette radical SAM/SPASM protein ScmE [Thermodesulfobacteriota bacterium]
MTPRLRAPVSVDAEITSRCNLSCRYCYYFGNDAVVYSDLETTEWLNFFEELGRLSVLHVTFQGGEPFLRDDFADLIQRVVRCRMRFSILTNGTLIDDTLAALIAGTGRCDGIQVSLDGNGPAIHDSCRGQGSFVEAVRGIRILQRHGVTVTTRVTVQKLNVDVLEDMASFLLNDLNLTGFSVNSAAYLGTCRLNADDILLTVDERGKAMRTLWRLKNQYSDRITSSAGPLAEATYWNEMEKARADNRPPMPGRGRLTGCGCYHNKIAVRSDGMIVPCTMLAHMELGRINHDALPDVWRHSPLLNELRSRNNMPLSSFPFCSDCLYIPYCTGNCAGLAYSMTGQVNHPAPDACLRRYLAMGGALPLEE